MERLTIGPFKNKLSPQKLGRFSGLIFSEDSSDCQSEKIFCRQVSQCPAEGGDNFAVYNRVFNRSLSLTCLVETAVRSLLLV